MVAPETVLNLSGNIFRFIHRKVFAPFFRPIPSNGEFPPRPNLEPLKIQLMKISANTSRERIFNEKNSRKIFALSTSFIGHFILHFVNEFV
jgi:hypothetical protein